MIDLQRELNRTVQGFVAQIVELVRHAGQEALRTAFADPVAAGTATRRRERELDPGSPSPRRTPEDLDTLSKRLATFVRANPGLRITEINERLGTTTKDLTLLIRRLVADGVIHTRGQKRSMRYFAATSPEAELARSPAIDAQARTVTHVVERAVEPVGERAVAQAVGALPASGPDADWQRCLAGVLMLAERLQK